MFRIWPSTWTSHGGAATEDIQSEKMQAAPRRALAPRWHLASPFLAQQPEAQTLLPQRARLLRVKARIIIAWMDHSWMPALPNRQKKSHQSLLLVPGINFPSELSKEDGGGGDDEYKPVENQVMGGQGRRLRQHSVLGSPLNPPPSRQYRSLMISESEILLLSQRRKPLLSLSF